jgi:competence CoiA-like predicted nuclease
MSAKLFEEHLQEQMQRALQPPSCERPLALKNRPERENRQWHFKGKKLQHAEMKP